MENHPIPQDITGFQFKLIGDMTIKQFAYLACGVILGWITFILPIFILIKLPFALIFIGLGVASAFVPIEGRPFDLMIINYFKALFNPTRYVYQKIGGHMWFPQVTNATIQTREAAQTSPQSTQKLKDFLKSLPKPPKNRFDEKEQIFLNSLSSLSGTASINQSQKQQLADEQKKEDADNKSREEKKGLEEETNLLRKQLEEAKLAESSNTDSSSYEAAHTKVLELENLLGEVQSQKQSLESQIIELKKRLETQKQQIFTPGVAQVRPETQSVRKVPKELGKSIGLPIMPEFPNIIAGIVKDPRNNPLPNILVEVKDESGNPVRAFKTNVLGQFASATPLANGTYAVSFEDPKEENKFDTIEVRVKGEILMPIEVISLDTREELRRSLFNPGSGKI
ncbi:MAG: hypothetical protein A3H50_00560 [Candidatus Levybacteria bacterium RIFCSPLOWO2_02_FULL_37_10]|nr:MAG: hypothetical protein A2860_02195 [Candidatus Levybacteria bacterium RIFCSPHIGHO2_01_FULL_37_33]OGH29723.1 MAG: hypothetical protein A3F30_00370 [Candidatus Levybacteria bacterium RIFCSPHIGHO2_12_FULL_37_12]OGH44175.1 MAG: hypothetical protein A3H50_00560 [Candidatus Levybacteria bacterium RIFCSPLOWO2_02_FULL_37_10]